MSARNAKQISQTPHAREPRLRSRETGDNRESDREGKFHLRTRARNNTRAHTSRAEIWRTELPSISPQLPDTQGCRPARAQGHRARVRDGEIKYSPRIVRAAPPPIATPSKQFDLLVRSPTDGGVVCRSRRRGRKAKAKETTERRRKHRQCCLLITTREEKKKKKYYNTITRYAEASSCDSSNGGARRVLLTYLPRRPRRSSTMIKYSYCATHLCALTRATLRTRVRRVTLTY